MKKKDSLKKITLQLDSNTSEKLKKMAQKMKVDPIELLTFFYEIGFPPGWNVKSIVKRKA